KFIVAVCASAVIWSWILLTVYVVAPRLTTEATDFLGTISAGSLAALCVLTFGVGWLGSACLETTIVPTLLAFAAPIVLSLVLLAICNACGIPRFEMSNWSGPVFLAVGVAAFALGTCSYIRRVEP